MSSTAVGNRSSWSVLVAVRLLTTADYANFPRFESFETHAGWHHAVAQRVAVVLAWLGVVTAMLLIWTNFRLSRVR